MSRSTRETWAKRVQGWLASDLTAKEFASENGVNPGTLTYWKWKLGSEAKARTKKPSTATLKRRPPPRAQFVEVSPTLLAPSPALEVVVGEHVVRVPSGFDADALREVIAVLEARG